MKGMWVGLGMGVLRGIGAVFYFLVSKLEGHTNWSTNSIIVIVNRDITCMSWDIFIIIFVSAVYAK